MQPHNGVKTVAVKQRWLLKTGAIKNKIVYFVKYILFLINKD